MCVGSRSHFDFGWKLELRASPLATDLSEVLPSVCWVWYQPRGHTKVRSALSRGRTGKPTHKHSSTPRHKAPGFSVPHWAACLSPRRFLKRGCLTATEGGPPWFPGRPPPATLGSVWPVPSLPLWRGCDVLGSSPKNMAALGTLTSSLLQGTGLEPGDRVSGLLGKASYRMTRSITSINHQKCQHFVIQAQCHRLPLTLRSGTEILRQDTLFLSSEQLDPVRCLGVAAARLRPVSRRRVLRPEQVRIAVLPPQILGSLQPWAEAHSTALPGAPTAQKQGQTLTWPYLSPA